MMRQTVIGGRTIGPDQPPFIIAEMSGNHNQSLDGHWRLSMRRPTR